VSGSKADSHADESPEDEQRRGFDTILGSETRALWRLSLGLGQRNRREERQEGSLVAMSR
jgi:hypothetical protein